MKRFPRFCRGLEIGLFLLVSFGLNADVIILKSGDKKSGKILAEDDLSVTLQYDLWLRFKDGEKIPKSEIREIVHETPAQLEYRVKRLDEMLPTRDLLSASDYESIIQDDLRTFTAKYPGTPEAKKVEKMIVTLNDEKAKVLSRQVKMEEKWLDETTAKREKYNIEAYRLRVAMKTAAQDASQDQILPKEIMALRAFETLRTSYPASMQYLHAIDEALEILDKYDQRLAVMRLDQPVLKANREKAISSTTGTDQKALKNAIEQEERTFKTTVDAQTKAKVKWKDIYKYDVKSLQDAHLLVAKEKQDLKTINKPALQNEIESLNAAIRYIVEGNFAEANVIMARLRPTKTTLINENVFDELDQKLEKGRGQ